MSSCTFIASDHPLPEIYPPADINVGTGTVCYGDADDNFFLLPFDTAGYSDKRYGMRLEWQSTSGRTKRLIQYIGEALRHTGSVELWHVWLSEYHSYEESPVIHRRSISLNELTPSLLTELDNAPVWNIPDKRYPDRPSFYCLRVSR